uniref:Serpin domain-containing protein n=1 Tax=Timema douglasi TaxID=61478 RepID=A0A7R8VNI7_TIMDO|nr:unnamed protein product [Timema douglasi]
MVTGVVLCVCLAHAHQGPRWGPFLYKRPMDAMVDVTNDLGVAVLQDYSYSRSNFAFSPYGVASVLVALYEGARGESARQIHNSLRLPWDRHVTRIGFRDLHRQLRTYFTHDGYLSGLTLNKNQTSLLPEYKQVLRFYGYDVGQQTPVETPSTISPEVVTNQTHSQTTSQVKESEITDIMNETQTTDSLWSTTETSEETKTTYFTTITETFIGENTTDSFYTVAEEDKTTMITETKNETTAEAFSSLIPETTEEPQTSMTVTEQGNDIRTTTIESNLYTTVIPSTTILDQDTTKTPEHQSSLTTTYVASSTTMNELITDRELETTMTQLMTEKYTMVSLTEESITQDSVSENTSEPSVITTTKNTITMKDNLPTTEQTKLSEIVEIQELTTEPEHSQEVNKIPDKIIPSTELLTEMTTSVLSMLPVEYDLITTPSNELNMINFEITLSPQESTINSVTLEQLNIIDVPTFTNPPSLDLSTQSDSSLTDKMEKISQSPSDVSSPPSETNTNKVTSAPLVSFPQSTTEKLNSLKTSVSPINPTQIVTLQDETTTQNEIYSVATNLPPTLPTGQSLTTNDKETVLENTSLSPDNEAGLLYNTLFSVFENGNSSETTTQMGNEEENTNTINADISKKSEEVIDRTMNRKRRSFRGNQAAFYPDVSLQLENGMFDSVVARSNELYTELPRFPFLVDGVSEEKVPVMTYTSTFPFAFIPRLHALALEFPLEDSHHKLLLLLPLERRGLRQLIYDMTSVSLREVFMMLRPTRVSAIIPSFMVEGFVILTPTLQQMGIWDVFDPRRANLSGMSPDPDLYVRNIEQAVTVVIRNYVKILDIQTRTMAARTITERFIATHPFLYFVVDADTKVSLMAGKMVDPLNSRLY